EEGRARVTDFGIARAGASDMTLTGSIMGTAQYLSPEQAQGHTVSGSSDLYSVGVILYELLTGVVPFEGETAVAIAFKQVSAAPRAPSELNPAVPPSLDAVVLRALAKDPAARYADADELIAALQRERDALPAFADTDAATAVEGHVHHVQPHPAAPATGSLLLAPAGSFDPDYGPPPLDERVRRRRRALWWTLAAVLLAAAAVLAVLLLQSKQMVTVPNVAAQSEQAAGASLRSAGLDPVPSLAASTTVPVGLVISQSPQPGSRVEKGSRVSIVVSGGPASAALVDVAGLTVARAAAQLRKAGFKPASKAQASPTVKAGRVISTEPPAGTEVQVGSTVTMLVSSGPAPVDVPDVTGQSLTAAEAALAEAELALGTVTEKVSTTQTPGTVLSQSPNGGRSVRAGSKVDLTVAKEPKEVAVPGVVGDSEVQAVATLEKAGFVVKTVNEVTSDATQVGTVLKQSPTAPAKAHRGDTVTIAIGALNQQPPPTTTTTTTPAPTPPPVGAG
ncbi:MAG TPA: PASTA domain-containing protein, partial [Solirubrobacteraceae bacterium]|nr:PASTA domain-containing protein [Solirubrobacteraceae bacterium]